MNTLDFLDLVIGLIFIYLIYSIACSTAWEVVINLSHLRGRMFYSWLKLNFDNKKLYDKIAGHAMVKGLSRPKQKSQEYKRPNYISAGVFTDVLMDLIVHEDENSPTTFDINVFKAKLEQTKLIDPELKRIFMQYVSDASGNFQLAKEKIGKWFDETQERLIGSYKKKVQWWIFIISIVLVGSTNADTFTLVNYLYGNDDARKALADKAVGFVQDTAGLNKIVAIDTLAIDSATLRSQEELIAKIDQDIATIKELNEDLKETGIPVGWSKEQLAELKSWNIIKKIGGLLLTVFAVSLGAPFWFDILSKIASLRSSGTKPRTLLEEQGEK